MCAAPDRLVIEVCFQLFIVAARIGCVCLCVVDPRYRISISGRAQMIVAELTECLTKSLRLVGRHQDDSHTITNIVQFQLHAC